MSELHPLLLGFDLLAGGALLLLLAALAPRLKPRVQQSSRLAVPLAPPLAGSDMDSHSHAVLLIRPGGRVGYLNQQAREWFHAWEERPNLERLANRTRPGEAFLGLCASEGQASLWLSGRTVEASSYLVPSEEGPAMLVTLRRPEWRVIPGADGLPVTRLETPGQAFRLFAQFNQSVTTSLDLEETVFAVLHGLGQLVPFDAACISLQGDGDQPPQAYHLAGNHDSIQRVEKHPGGTPLVPGFASRVGSSRQPLLIPETGSFPGVGSDPKDHPFPYTAYLGLPLLVGDGLERDLEGVLELAVAAPETFTQDDLDLLLLFCGQIAIALCNARRHQAEQQRSRELSVLAELARLAIVADDRPADEPVEAPAADKPVEEPQGLYQHLVEAIHPLMEADILGFLLYDPLRGELKGQVPFAGLSADVIESYHAFIRPGSPAEQVWRSGTAIVTEDGPEDPRLAALGLHDLQRAFCIRQTVLAPLIAAGRCLGYLQAANPRTGEPFQPETLHLLETIAGQAAAMISNTVQVKEARGRAQRADTLRRIANLAISEATPDEKMKFSLQDLARMLQAEVAVLFRLDEAQGLLRLDRVSAFGVSPEDASRFARLSPGPATAPVLDGNLTENQEVLPSYRPLVEQLGLVSAIRAPLVHRGRSLGELLLGSSRQDAFNQGDLLSAASVAGQLAAVLSQASLASQTDTALRRRVDQMTALTRISQELNTTLDLDHLLQRVLEEAVRATGADCGSVLLLVLEATNPQRVQILRQFGDLHGPGLAPFEQAALDRGESQVVNDTVPGDEASQAESPQFEHPGVRSALVVPIAYQDQVAGLIHLHSTQPRHFDQDSRQIGEALAVQAAIAIGNAHRYHDQVIRSELLNRRVETLSRLFEAAQVLQEEQPLEQALDAIAGAIQSTTPFDVVWISVYDPESNRLLRVAGAGDPPEGTPIGQILAWDEIVKLLRPEFLTGRCYFIPQELHPALPDALHSVAVSPFHVMPSHVTAWHPDDLLLAPLLGSHEQVLGLISVDEPRDRLRPDLPCLETLEIFSAQAAILIESRIRLHSLRLQVEALSRQAAEAQEQAQVLLLQDREQKRQLHRLAQVARWAQAGLQVAEAAKTVGHAAGQGGVLQAIAAQLAEAFGLDTALVAEATPGGLHLLSTYSTLQAGSRLDEQHLMAQLGQRNPLKTCLETGESLLAADIDEDPAWQNSPLLRSLEAGSLLCLPVHSAGAVTAAILVTGAGRQESFVAPDSQLIRSLTSQIDSTFHTFEQTGQASRRMQEVSRLLEFSRQLGSLDPGSIFQALVDQACHLLASAQAGLAVQWEPAHERLAPRAASGYPSASPLMDITFRTGEALVGQAFQQRRPICVDEIDASRHFNLDAANLLRYHDAAAGRLPVSCLVVPIIGATQAEPLGVLALENFTTPAAFGEQDQALVASLVQQTALALDNAILFTQTRSLKEDLEQRVAERTAELAGEHQRTQMLLRILTELSASLDLDQVLSRTLSILNEVFDAGQITVFITRPGEQTLLRLASIGYAGSALAIDYSLPFDQNEGLAGWVLSHRQPVLVSDLRQDPRWIEQPGDFDRRHRSALAVPLLVGAEALGVLLLYHDLPGHFQPSQLDVVEAAANQVAVAVNNAELYRLIRDQAEDLGALLRKQQEQTSRSRAILEAVANGVLVTDAHKTITLFNAAAEEILGLSRSQVLGQSLEQFSGLFGSRAKLWRETIQAWSRDPQACQAEGSYSAPQTAPQTAPQAAPQITLENGRVLQVHLAPVILDRDFLGTISIFQDITHQVEVDRLKSEFVATASHELRTPLTSIKGYVDLLLMGVAGEVNPQQAQALEVVRANSERLSGLVGDLLDVSRNDAGMVRLNRQPFDLPELVSEALDELKRRARDENRPMEITCDCTPGLPTVYADRKRANQVLGNLLDNAYRYNLPAGCIRVRAFPAGEFVQVDVQDTGMGVPLAEQGRIFERFFRGQNPLEMGVPGTGLGLSIVKDLVQMHGGQIWMESSGLPGEGATFSFTLPLNGIPGTEAG